MTNQNKNIRAKTISLCMIMKDEADWLPSCLNSIKALVDEMIIVDTGSSDSSVEIAKSFNAKVLFHPWVDDFSKVRNFSLQHATCDWILVLDADEIINLSDHNKIRKLINKEHACYLLTQRHYTDDVRLSGFEPCKGEFPENEFKYAGYFESALARLFPNFEGIHYRGAVHELVEYCLDDLPEITLYDPKIRIHHYGHTSQVKVKKDKSKLYTPLGEKKVNDESRGWKEYFELAVEHNNNRRLEDSVVAFEESLKLNSNYVASWINLGYVYCELGDFEKAKSTLIQAIKLDPMSEEGFCNLGVVELRQKNYLKAEALFKKAINLKPSYMNSWRNLSIALISMERFSEAALVLKRMIEIIPSDKQSILTLGSLYLNQGDPVEALRYFSFIYSSSSTDIDLAKMITHSIKQAGDAAGALRFLTSHIVDHEKYLEKEEVVNLKTFLDSESVQFFLS